MKKVVQVFTVSLSTIFIEGLTKKLNEAGFELIVISADGEEARRGVQNEGFVFYPVNMDRGISPFQNLKAWFRIREIIKREKPDIVHGNTPIGGLISMTTAWSLGIKSRFYTLHGLKYPGEFGIKRYIVKALEKTTISFATKVFAVSKGLVEFAVKEGLTDEGKISVLHNGSVKGIDISTSRGVREKGRYYYESKFGFSHKTNRIGFFGRITEEKGVPELIEALLKLKQNGYLFETLFCGVKEFQNVEYDNQFEMFNSDDTVLFPGLVSTPLEYMKTCDLIVLPTHREGFGLVNIEANSVGVPVITTDVMGCKDSIENEKTGYFYQAGNVDELYRKLQFCLDNPEKLKELGNGGIQRAEQLFNREDIWNKLVLEYTKCKVH